eukprot:2652333-Rhodomonas_salina.1
MWQVSEPRGWFYFLCCSDVVFACPTRLRCVQLEQEGNAKNGRQINSLTLRLTWAALSRGERPRR